MQPACAGPRSPTWFCFNPHPARRPDATAGLPPARLSPTCFNPHPARRPGATRPLAVLALGDRVSILIRPEGRMQLFILAIWPSSHALFQSSSGQKAGCNARWQRYFSFNKRCFNPHPAFWPDATRFRMPPAVRGLPWFQSSSGQKAGCNPRLGGSQPHHLRCFNPHPARRPDATQGDQHTPLLIIVSILIRPEGRMQPHQRGPLVRHSAGFNPHPARRPDATPAPAPTTQIIHRFQSSSGQKAGCNAPLDDRGGIIVEVSILIRPEGRMQQVARKVYAESVGVSILIRPEGRMQPSPELVTARSCVVSILIRPEGRMQLCSSSMKRVSPILFQSSSGQKAGCNARRRPVDWRGRRGFNPHPARRPDATFAVNKATNTWWDVSILIRPEGRMQRARGVPLYRRLGVSILIRPEGRMQR